MEGSVFSPTLEGMKNVKSDRGELLTKPLLDVCKHILPILDKFGAAMTVVKSDIGGKTLIAFASAIVDVYEEHLFSIWKTFILEQSSILEIQCFCM
ncbi:glycolipid transfer protein 1-like [Camellia sinensis]|uniref:glycolipid transfer protein 1-like n=1 Tax=Camellia sinensis TaxID=4442 RepID=UPI00103581B4|nr:glycolipid transfer protein 1-like [Camellia sinensis]XP_028072738.1 glycolipid transfer protein 1-like [Camellia sinensis]